MNGLIDEIGPRGRRRVRCRPVGLKRETIRRTVATLAMVFDFDGITPKPARDKRVRLPREREGGIDHFAAYAFYWPSGGV